MKEIKTRDQCQGSGGFGTHPTIRYNASISTPTNLREGALHLVINTVPEWTQTTIQQSIRNAMHHSNPSPIQGLWWVSNPPYDLTIKTG